jgi:hypothetical protein
MSYNNRFINIKIINIILMLCGKINIIKKVVKH